MKAKISAQAQTVLDPGREALSPYRRRDSGRPGRYRNGDRLPRAGSSDGNGSDSQALPRQKERGLRIHPHQSHALRL